MSAESINPNQYKNIGEYINPQKQRGAGQGLAISHEANLVGGGFGNNEGDEEEKEEMKESLKKRPSAPPKNVSCIPQIS